MNVKTVGTIIMLTFVAVSVGYLIIGETSDADYATESTQSTVESPSVENGSAEDASGPVTTGSDAAPSGSAAEPPQPANKVIAYYFHNTQRCRTCNKIERLAEEALREQFARALEEGELEWRVVNMEEPPNTHFVQDYQLVASSLVLVDLHDGQQRDWTNMEKVWQYVHDDEVRFKQYVAEQTRKYLES